MEGDAEDQPSDDTLGFLPLLGGLGDILGWEDGGQGWIRTSVRKPGQIYSLLPLTTRPPVLGARFGKRSNGETRLACQCQSWERRPHEAIFPSPPPATPEERRVGQEWVMTSRDRRSPYQ